MAESLAEPSVEQSAKKAPRKPRVKKEENATVEEKKEEVREETPKKTVRKPRAKKEENATVVEEKAEEKKPAERKKKPVKKEEIVESKQEEKKEEQPTLQTRAEKMNAVKGIIKELLTEKNIRRTALIDETSRLYAERFPSDETSKVSDVKGRVGSVITLMEGGGEVFYENGEFSLKSKEKGDVKVEEKAPEEEKKKEEPFQEENHLPVVAPEAKLAPVFDLSALLGEKSKAATPSKKESEKPQKDVERTKKKEDEGVEKKTRVVKEKEEKSTPKKAKSPKQSQDKTKDRFLRKMRDQGGSYLEYYAVYLLQRYAQKNGRRLEGLKVSGGERDGGIDGEIELTDTFGFRETLYIQAKNWAPTDEKWMVGETLLQQFIGAVTYRMAREGKSHGRGVYVTTSKFSEGAKKMLDEMSDKFVGYDGDELYELAKECAFGVMQKEGEWVVDEKLLSGEKAFFNL